MDLILKRLDMAVLLGSAILIFYYLVLNLVLEGFSSNFVRKKYIKIFIRNFVTVLYQYFYIDYGSSKIKIVLVVSPLK